MLYGPCEPKPTVVHINMVTYLNKRYCMGAKECESVRHPCGDETTEKKKGNIL